MADTSNSLPALNALIEERLATVGRLAESLEASESALARNDAEAIARGAAHQAELCRQWSGLEDQLRRARSAANRIDETEPALRLEAEWNELRVRIHRLTRVHWSLLRHLQRSLAILERVAESCAPTYAAAPRSLLPEARVQAGGQ